MQTHDEAEVGRAAAQRRGAAARKESSLDVARAVADPANASPASLVELQRLAGNASVSRLISGEEEQAERSPVLDVVGSGGGSPLDDSLRSEMEGRLGADFGDVRVHTGARASESAQSVQANAYTVGSDVVFGDGQWSPGTEDGKRTLAHELTHVVQQRSGPVAGTDVGGGIRLSSPGDEFERAADQTADVALSAPASAHTGGAGAAIAQRQVEEEVPEEEQVQASFVQRQTEEEVPGEEEEQG